MSLEYSGGNYSELTKRSHHGLWCCICALHRISHKVFLFFLLIGWCAEIPTWGMRWRSAIHRCRSFTCWHEILSLPHSSQIESSSKKLSRFRSFLVCSFDYKTGYKYVHSGKTKFVYFGNASFSATSYWGALFKLLNRSYETSYKVHTGSQLTDSQANKKLRSMGKGNGKVTGKRAVLILLRFLWFLNEFIT